MKKKPENKPIGIGVPNVTTYKRKTLTAYLDELTNRLDNLPRERYCKKCKHSTLQHKVPADVKSLLMIPYDYKCLNCGTLWWVSTVDEEVKSW
jgi:5-methylcytosine-specific restriction endonuclease McrA